MNTCSIGPTILALEDLPTLERLLSRRRVSHALSVDEPFSKDPFVRFCCRLDRNRAEYLLKVESYASAILPTLESGGQGLDRLKERLASNLWDAVAEVVFAGRAVQRGFQVRFEPDGASGPDLLLGSPLDGLYVEVCSPRPLANVEETFSLGERLRKRTTDLETADLECGFLFRARNSGIPKAEFDRIAKHLEVFIRKFVAGERESPSTIFITRGGELLPVEGEDGHGPGRVAVLREHGLPAGYLTLIRRPTSCCVIWSSGGAVAIRPPGSTLRAAIAEKVKKKKKQLRKGRRNVVAVETYWCGDNLDHLPAVLYETFETQREGRIKNQPPLFQQTSRLSAVWGSCFGTRSVLSDEPGQVLDVERCFISNNPNVEFTISAELVDRLSGVR